jgi:hypothetical protein
MCYAGFSTIVCSLGWFHAAAQNELLPLGGRVGGLLQGYMMTTLSESSHIVLLAWQVVPRRGLHQDKIACG